MWPPMCSRRTTFDADLHRLHRWTEVGSGGSEAGLAVWGLGVWGLGSVTAVGGFRVAGVSRAKDSCRSKIVLQPSRLTAPPESHGANSPAGLGRDGTSCLSRSFQGVGRRDVDLRLPVDRLCGVLRLLSLPSALELDPGIHPVNTTPRPTSARSHLNKP